MNIRVAHSPDSDDAFMFYGLATGKVDTRGYHFTHHLDDIETLNQAAAEGCYEVTALSIHAYAHLYRKYALLSTGASMGERYGPLVVSRSPMTRGELKGRRIAVPGLQTSAYLALKLLEPELSVQVVPFDRIIDAVRSGGVDAGLIIHEGQLSYERAGLSKVIDLGEWWYWETRLPLPLGGNAVRRDLGVERMKEISAIIGESIRYGLDHRADALEYALDFGRGLTPSEGDRFVGMYVNQRTLDYGEDGRRAVQLFLDRGFESGHLPERVRVEFF
jgi:1,4-dihydroxy-6-naphthoate synthase